MADVDLASELGPARDQGPRATCLAFAVTACHEQARARRRSEDRQRLTEELLYWAAKQIDGDSEPGTGPGSARVALRDTGQPEAHHWPYDGSRDEGAGYAPPPAALAPGLSRHASLEAVGTDRDALRAELAGGRAVVLGIQVWKQFYTPDRGRLETPDQSDLLDEAHALVLVGFQDDTGCFSVRNSWGPGWGNDGHAELPYGALGMVSLGAWVVVDDLDG